MTTSTPDWSNARAPNFEEFGQLVQETWDVLPEDFRALCPNLIFQIEEFPEEEILEELECETPYELFGFFYGADSEEPTMMSETSQHPNTLWLFRRPVLDYWAEEGVTLKETLTHIIITEVGHYFGLSDHDRALVELEAGGRQTEIVH